MCTNACTISKCWILCWKLSGALCNLHKSLILRKSAIKMYKILVYYLVQTTLFINVNKYISVNTKKKKQYYKHIIYLKTFRFVL